MRSVAHPPGSRLRFLTSLAHLQRPRTFSIFPHPTDAEQLFLLPYFCVTLQSLSNVFTGFTFWVAQQSREKFKAGFFFFFSSLNNHWCFTSEKTIAQKAEGAAGDSPWARRQLSAAFYSKSHILSLLSGESVVSCHVTVSPPTPGRQTPHSCQGHSLQCRRGQAGPANTAAGRVGINHVESNKHQVSHFSLMTWPAHSVFFFFSFLILPEGNHSTQITRRGDRHSTWWLRVTEQGGRRAKLLSHPPSWVLVAILLHDTTSLRGGTWGAITQCHPVTTHGNATDIWDRTGIYALLIIWNLKDETDYAYQICGWLTFE